METTDRRRFLTSLMVPFTLAACSPGSESEKVAKSFIDAYYVQINLKAAKELSSGLASEKIGNQLSLVDDQAPGQGADIPKVDVRLTSHEDASPSEATYIFEVKPEVEDVGKRKVFVKLREQNGRWTVSQFTEETSNSAPQNQ